MWEGFVIAITPRSCQQWKRWTTEGCGGAAATVQAKSGSRSFFSKDVRRSLCVGTTNNTGKEKKNQTKHFSVQMRQVNNTTEALMLIL